MLEHHAESQGERQTDSALNRLSGAAESAWTPAADSLLREKWVEDYLDRVYAPLVGVVPYRQRQEIRRELRAHLDQLIAAHEELGSDPEEATSAALRQFGAPEVVARKWLGELGEQESAAGSGPWPVQPPGSSLPFAAVRMAVGVSAWALSGVLLDRYLSNGSACVYLSIGVAIPIIIGYQTGQLPHRKRPVRTMLLAQLMTIPFWPTVMMLLMNLFYGRQPDWTAAFLFGAVSTLAVAPLGSLGAWYGARRRRQRARRSLIVS